MVLKRTVGFKSTFRSVCSDRLLAIAAYIAEDQPVEDLSLDERV